MVRIWPLKKRKKEERRKCALTEILLFHDSTQSTVQVQTFFFAPLFRQSNVQNGEKLVYWSIWTTFWPAAASLENWQIKLILQHCISASLAHTQKVLLKLACAKKNHTSCFKVFSIVTFRSDIKVRRPNSEWSQKAKGIEIDVWWSRPNWISRE